MCSSGSNTGTLMPFGLKISGGQLPYYPAGSSHLSVDIHRAQLQDYAQRLQLGLRSFPGQVAGLNPLAYHGHLMHPYLHPYFCKDPRARFVHEEPKPNHSYIGLIAMAILSSRDKKLVLSDIYQWILDNYSYFRTRGPGWRNSIRHNLSLNDCFIKAGRSANGKGHYWAIHPANIDDFQKGDFRRRRAQRRVRKHMGLAVPDDDDDDSPSPSPAPTQHSPNWVTGTVEINIDGTTGEDETTPPTDNDILHCKTLGENRPINQQARQGFRRQFDVESLLAPDTECYKKMRAERFPSVHALEEPSEIFAFEQGSLEHPKAVDNNISESNEEENDENESKALSDTFNKNYDNENMQVSDDDKNVVNIRDNDCHRNSDSDGVSECSVLHFRNSEDSKDNGAEGAALSEKHYNSEPSSPNNQSTGYSDNNESGPQHIESDTGHMTHAYFNANNCASTHGMGTFYSAKKQAMVRSVGQLSKFPLIPRQGLLGTPLDLEAAQRWQQSMAALLMKAQMKDRNDQAYPVMD